MKIPINKKKQKKRTGKEEIIAGIWGFQKVNNRGCVRVSDGNDRSKDNCV